MANILDFPPDEQIIIFYKMCNAILVDTLEEGTGVSRKFIEEFVEREVTTSAIQLLNIELEHLRINATLPFHHRDPFDRLIIAQSMAEDIPIVSVDSAFDKYSVNLIN